MASYHQLVGTVTRDLTETEHTFHLYMFQRAGNIPGGNENFSVVPPNLTFVFGCVAAVDWIIHDGADPNNSKLVARGRGCIVGNSMSSPGYFLSIDIVFTDDRLKGSTLKLLGSYVNDVAAGDNHVSVVGGTGQFEYAQGTCKYKAVKIPGPEIIREVDIRVFCRNISPQPPTPTPAPASKDGPFGGNGGDAFDIPEEPHRLESITIRMGYVIDSFAYSYIDKAGKKQTVGPSGGNGGHPETINFAQSEVLKKVFGKTAQFGGSTVVTSLTFVTNLATYGPYGKIDGTPFTIPGNDTDKVVGFFGRSGVFLDALGGYSLPSATK